MSRIVLVLLLATAWLDAHAQSSLPPCPENKKAIWANCEYGTGIRYAGEFRDGKRNGQGMYTFADGRYHVGEYRDNKRNGRGTLYNVNGTVRASGMWRDDQFLQSSGIDTARLPVNASSGIEAREEDPFYDAKAQCRELGFKEKTEKFGGCVLTMSK